MGRTQVYLGAEELELVDRVAGATGASRSELIRRAVRRTFGTTNGRHFPMLVGLRPAY